MAAADALLVLPDPSIDRFAAKANVMAEPDAGDFIASSTGADPTRRDTDVGGHLVRLHQPVRIPEKWNATLLEGDLADSVSSVRDKHHGNLVVSGAGELARDMMAHGLVDEVWFTVSPYL